ncbi:MAG: hypothetical protein ACT4P1_03130 [Sporichthyaceae bacterium]
MAGSTSAGRNPCPHRSELEDGSDPTSTDLAATHALGAALPPGHGIDMLQWYGEMVEGASGLVEAIR